MICNKAEAVLPKGDYAAEFKPWQCAASLMIAVLIVDRIADAKHMLNISLISLTEPTYDLHVSRFNCVPLEPVPVSEWLMEGAAEHTCSHNRSVRF